MADERKRRRWPWIVLAIFVLYALSPGPYWWLVNRLYIYGYVGEREAQAANAVAAIYWPLQQIAEVCPPVRQFYEWYSELFVFRD